nr:hypothetical protein [Tanacetum cinerariifolium]
MTYRLKVSKPKNVGIHESLATPKPRNPRFLLRWSPTGKMFDSAGKLIAPSGDNACTSNTVEPKIRRFPNSTSLLGKLSRFVCGASTQEIVQQTFIQSIFMKWPLHHQSASWLELLLLSHGYGIILSHLNFDTINDLARNDLVAGLLKFKYNKEHLCPSCEQGKSKRASHPPKPVLNSRQRLHLLYMDLCRPMRIASINGKRYVLVIVDDYSLYTWVHFLRSKDEAPEVIIKFLKRITVLLQSPVIIIRTDNDTEFKNQVLNVYFDPVGITHQMYSVRTPQQNGVVERRNRTLVEAARTMLIFSRAPLFLWAEAIATAKPDISFLHVFGALCYPKNDREDIGKLGAKGDIGFFIGYSADSCAYRIYNRRQRSSKPELQCMTSGQISSGLDLTYAPSTITKQQPTDGELDLLFKVMYDDYFGGQPSPSVENVLPAQEPQVRQTSTASTTITDNVPIPTNSSSHATNIVISSQGVDELNPNAMVDGNTFVNPFVNSSTSATVASSSSQNVDPSNMHTFYQPYPHEFQWNKDHPLEQVIGELSRPVLTRNQLRSDGDMCIYALTSEVGSLSKQVVRVLQTLVPEGDP